MIPYGRDDLVDMFPVPCLETEAEDTVLEVYAVSLSVMLDIEDVCPEIGNQLGYLGQLLGSVEYLDLKLDETGLHHETSRDDTGKDRDVDVTAADETHCLPAFDVYLSGKEGEKVITVKKGENAELIEKFNAGLKNIQANGKYDEIIAKYLG